MGRICYFYPVLIFGGMHPPNVNLALVNFTLIEHKIKTTLSLSEGKKFKIINNLLHFSFIKNSNCKVKRFFYYFYLF